MPLKATACLVFLLLYYHSAYSQTAVPECASEADSPQCQVTKAVEAYLAALQKKDWNRLSQLGIHTRSDSFASYPGSNLALRQLQVLLARLDVQVMTAVVRDVMFTNSFEARVRYSLRIKAVDPNTGNMNLDVSDANRVILMRRLCLNCVAPAISWLIERDSAGETDLKRDLAKAKTPDERTLLLLGSDRLKLGELSTALMEDGISHLQSSRFSEAFEAFASANQVAKYFQNEESVSAELDAEEAEQKIEVLHTSKQGILGANPVSAAVAAYAKRKEYDKALACYERNVTLLENAPELLAETYLQVAEVYGARGDRRRAINYYRKSYDLLISLAPKTITDDSFIEDLTEPLIGLVFFHEMEGEHLVAEDLFRDANARVNDEKFRAYLSFFHALMQWVRGDFFTATTDGEKAFALFSKMEADEDTNEALFSMAFILSMLHSAQQNYRQAAENFRRTRKHLVIEDDEDVEDLIKVVEGVFYSSQGVQSVLMSRMDSLMPLVTGKVPRGISVPDFLAFQGTEYLRREQTAIALQCWRKAIEFATELDDKRLLVRLHNLLAGYYSSTDQETEALEHYYASLAFAEKSDSILTMISNQATNPSNLRGIAQILVQQKRYDEAIALYQKVLNTPTMFSLFSAQVYQDMAGAYYAQGNYREALNQYERAIEACEKNGVRFELTNLYQHAARVLWHLGEYSLAQSKLETAIEEIEQNRKDVVGGELVLSSFFEDRIAPYHDMVAMLISRGDTDGALTYAERVKSRLLLDALKYGRKYAGKFMSQAEQQQEKALRTGLISFNRKISEALQNNASSQATNALRAQRAAARLDYEVFKANLYVNHPELLTERPKDEFSLKALKHSLPDKDTVLLEYVVTETESYLFVIYSEPDAKVSSGARSFLQMYPLGIGSRDLADKISYFHLRVAHPEGPIDEPARDLYRLLLKPAERQLNRRKNLIIIPDASLWDLPFQALKPSGEVFLIDEKAISYAPSLVALEEIRKAHNINTLKTPTLLAVGNPALREKSQALPKTEELAKKLEALYGKTRSRVLVGPNADEEHVKALAGRYGIVHIGTHGVLDDQNPMYSYVSLAETGLDDGTTRKTQSSNVDRDDVLEAWELMNLELKAELVVLSACETARGQVTKGEGVVGLTWALFMAGAPTTVVSQWKVESESANELMFLFHKTLLAGKRQKSKLSPAQALQRSAITLKQSEKFRHPYYWAGFIVMGDGAR